MTRLVRLAATAAFIIAAALAIRSHYYLNIAVFAGLNVVLAMGLNLLLGFAGQVSLGHAAFYAIGAYGVGVLSTSTHLSSLLCILASLCLAAAVAYLIGLPTLRLKGHYLALATLGFGLIVQILLVEVPSLTGGPSGLPGIPSLRVWPFIIRGDRAFAVLVWLLVVVIQAGLGRLRTSRAGRALLAIKDNEDAAASLGVDTGREKRAVFVASAVLAALAGGLYAYYINFISPETFGFNLSVQVLTMAVVGGLGTVWGPALGAVVLTVLPEFFRVADEYDTILYGLVLILTIAFLPDGLAPGGKRLLSRLRRWWVESESAST